MSATAKRLIELLGPHTPFAEAIVRRQAERAGLALERLTDSDVATLGPMLVKAAAVFIDPEALHALQAALGVR